MATHSVTPLIGVDVINTLTSASLPLNSAGTAIPPFALGTEVFASDGKRYVFAQAGGAISASTATCTVSPTTFQATGTAGSYTSPATAMSTGDYGWFGAASV